MFDNFEKWLKDLNQLVEVFNQKELVIQQLNEQLIKARKEISELRGETESQG